jgi:diguanylate cyclase (GGDEF)-like protein/PAS domain S-box-containing protein
MKLKFNSLRARILLIFVVLTITLFSSVRFTQQYVNDVTQSSLEIISEEQQLAQTLKIAKTGLRSAERIIYQYSLSPDNTKIQKINNIVKNAHFHIDTLLNNPTTQNNGLFRQPVLSLKQKLNSLSTQLSLINDSADIKSKQTVVKNTIHPVLTQVWQTIEQIDARLDNIMTENVLASVEATDTLYNFIWLYTSFTLLILIVGYFVFEFAVRRPLMLFSNAMEAYGSDASSIPNLKFKTEETSSLLKSFNNMKTQVDSRQRYLESILDNAGEGIITVNNNKTIETFNSAAKKLFGYTSEEVIGKEIFMLFPESDNEKNKDYYQNLFESGMDQPLPEINATIDARRKNARIFPLSIKTTNLELEGKHISIAIVDDVSERESMMKNLRKMAEHDALTGLFNRQYFMEELERNVAKISRSAIINCALLYIDLDNFKFVNDTLGHLAGDRVLVEVSAMINQHMSKNDIIARIGGDEFGILLNDVNSRQALKTAEHYRKQFTSYIFKYGGKEIDIGCSIGIALFDNEIVSKEDILARADIACHIAKNAGKNRVHIYTSEDQSNRISMYADIGWARQIKEAMEQDKFILAQQPIVDTNTGDLLSYEILLRMRDNNSDIILPNGFLPSAQRIGLMVDIDKWILSKSIATLKKVRENNSEVRFSINLSAKAMCDPEILMIITDALITNQIDPSSITFEITEDTAIANMDMAVKFLHQLKELGCKTALDDFGTGYSSFAYLKDLPVDYVKIDGSFVQNIDTDQLNLAMVKSMNEVAHATGKKTVAEFVKNQDILDAIKTIGIDYAQGYHIGKPELIS